MMMKALSPYPGLTTQPDSGGRHSVLRRVAQQFLRSQFGRPTGFWGNLAGRIMSRTRSNHERAQWTISLLVIKPTDRILEIGYGPGIAIELASGLAGDGRVVGVDHSEVMLRQATRRNAAAVRERRVELHLGSVAELPRFDEPFDKVFTINSIHFWAEPLERLKELRCVLKPGGMIAVTLQPRSRNATGATTVAIGNELANQLRSAGFLNVTVDVKQTTPVPVACVRGVK
jgi:ubiquinone/menaquinone biosynthesis C-methylase UbiE